MASTETGPGPDGYSKYGILMSRPRIGPVRFRWIDWNRDKVHRHGLSTDEVEFAWRRSLENDRHQRGGSFESIGRIPSGRMIRIIW